MDNEDSSGLTPERIAILVEFADNVVAGRKLLHWLSLLGVGVASIAALVYYITSAWRNVRGGGLH